MWKMWTCIANDLILFYKAKKPLWTPQDKFETGSLKYVAKTITTPNIGRCNYIGTIRKLWRTWRQCSARMFSTYPKHKLTIHSSLKVWNYQNILNLIFNTKNSTTSNNLSIYHISFRSLNNFHRRPYRQTDGHDLMDEILIFIFGVIPTND